MKRQDAEGNNPAPVREPNKKSDEIRQQERVPQGYTRDGKRPNAAQSAGAGGNHSDTQTPGDKG